MTTLYDKVAQFKADADLTHKYVHGPATGPNSVIATESGPVSTLAKQHADLAAELGADVVLNESWINANMASEKADEAAGSAASALSSKKDIDNRIYPDSYNSAPLTRPDGSPVQIGDEYADSTGVWFRHNGTTWIVNISTASLGAAGGAALVGYSGRTAADKLNEITSLADKGGVPGYAGIPLYDGADAGRIIATDNTAAFQALVNAAIAAGHSSVKIPAGHWSIKAGNLAFSNFSALRIFGDGIGVTRLDFIKEDATRAAYVGNANAPNVIASFSTGGSIEFADMTIAATTKAGVVNGTTGPANAGAVYYGAVWGFKINNVADVRFTRVRVEHFNYRGFSVYGSDTRRVTIDNCEGFYNVGSGFWIEDAAVVKVIGGEYAYNGIFGNPGTGYGVTASANVGKFIVDGPYCHHNFRKGIDSHGCSEFTLKGGTYENNVLFHFANSNWVPPAGVSDCSVLIKGPTMSNGFLPADETWLRTCYQALVANGFTTFTGRLFQITDTDSAGTVTAKIKSVMTEGTQVLCHYNGADVAGMTVTASPISIVAQSSEVLFKGNWLNFKKTTYTHTGNVYNNVLMELNSPKVKWVGNDVSFLSATAYTNSTSGLADYAAVMSLVTSSASQELDLKDNRWDLNDAYFTTSTSLGIRASPSWGAAGAKRIAIDNTWSFLDDRFKGTNSLSDAFFLGADSPTLARLVLRNNTFVRAGVRYVMPEPGLNKTSGSINWSSTASKLMGTDLFSIVLDKQHHLTIRISTEDGTPDLVIGVPFSAYTGITATTTNGLLSYSSIDSAFVEDGLTKLKINIKAKVDLSGDHWGRITVDGAFPSLGIERVIML